MQEKNVSYIVFREENFVTGYQAESLLICLHVGVVGPLSAFSPPRTSSTHHVVHVFGHERSQKICFVF